MISIIVPVYNVEMYLRACIDSILQQTYTDIEVILVDDGSTDDSGIICDEYAKTDNRIKVIHQVNTGLSSARNAGMAAAEGEYIGFVDSDDCIAVDMYEKLLYSILNNNADISECAVTHFKEEIKEIESDKLDLDDVIMSGYEALKLLLQINDAMMPRYAVWSKLFKKKVIADLRFPEGMIHEDHFYDAQAMLKAERYVINKQHLYFHRLREDSITGKRFSMKDFDKLKLIRQRTKYFENNNMLDLALLSQQHEWIISLMYYAEASQNGDMSDEANGLLSYLQSTKNDMLHVKMSYRARINILLFFIHPKIYLFYRQMKNRRT